MRLPVHGICACARACVRHCECGYAQAIVSVKQWCVCDQMHTCVVTVCVPISVFEELCGVARAHVCVVCVGLCGLLHVCACTHLCAVMRV